MRECRTCHKETPEGNFCVRCGAPLTSALEHPSQRHQFAAAPGERRYVPWLVSTLFPHLPRHSERHFHVALGAGAALVILLGVLRLFPVALISAALLMALLTILYFYDVDLYEGEPGWAFACTFGWGAVTGAGVGLVAKAIEPSGAGLIDRGSFGHVMTGGILIPALGVGAMLAGPLVMLRYRRFNETLDGATFGAATAATFAAGQAIVVGIGVLGGGLRPAGTPAPWVARLVGIAIATPVLAMSVVAAATAAVWLRYRAPIEDRHALGWSGAPPTAIALALVMVIAGAVAETVMAAGLWLAWMVLLDLVALVLLRRALHVGLLEEAAEIEIGPPIRCTNCAEMTATHTFCASCGIALKALPKVREPTADSQAGERQPGTFAGRLTGATHGRRSGRRRLIAFAAGIATVAGVAVGTVAIAAPSPPKPRCKLHQPCGAPPVLGESQGGFAGYTSWRSSALGYSLRYGSSDWQRGSQTPTDLALQSADGLSTISFHAGPSTQVSPSRLIDERISSLQGQMLGLVADTNPADVLLGAGVGLRPGPGNVYEATTSTPQGPGTPVAIAIMAAAHGNLSIVVTVSTPANNPDQQSTIYAKADDVINSVLWGQ